MEIFLEQSQNTYWTSSNSVVDPNQYGIDWEGPAAEEDDNIVIVNEPINILTDEQYQQLRSEVNPLETDEESFGVNVYKKTINVVANILRNN